MQSFLSGPTLTFDLQPQAAPVMPSFQQASTPASNMPMNGQMSQEQIMQMMMQLQQQMQTQQNSAPVMTQPVTIPIAINALPPMNTVQETVHAFTAEETVSEVYATPNVAHIETPVAQDFSTAVS